MAQGDGKGQQESQQKPEPRADEEAVLDENLFDTTAGRIRQGLDRTSMCV